MKPKYSLNKNFFYAVDGCKELCKEPAFKLEITAFAIATVILVVLPYPLWAKLFMFASLFIPLFAEAINTAIEKSVDLSTQEYNLLAKHAKDIAAFGVMLSIAITLFIWLGFIVLCT